MAMSRLQLCLEELLTNLATHQQGPSGPPRAWVGVSVRPGSIAVEVEDDGPEFDPLSVKAPDILGSVEQRPVGGLGLHLVRHLVDSPQYRRAQGRNRLSMSITLREA